MSLPDSFSNISDVSDGDLITAANENTQSHAINGIESLLTLNSPKPAVRAATASALSGYSYASNALTASANGALSVDGISPSAGDRILVKNEISGNAKYNGIYVVTNAGSGSATWVLTRSADMKLSAQASGAVISVAEGTANAGTMWVVTSASPFTINSSDITLAQLAGPPQAAVSMNSQRVTSVSDPTGAQDAATKHYVDNRSLSNFSAPTADLSMGTHKITNVTDPGAAQDAATKNYVDGRSLSNFSAPTADLPMGSHKITGVADASALTDAANGRVVQQGATNYATDSGTANAYAVTLSPAPASYTAGLVVRFKAANANTSASTINVNSLGGQAIKKRASTALEAGDIAANQLIELVYDGTNFQMVGTSQVSPTYPGQSSITTLGTITGPLKVSSNATSLPSPIFGTVLQLGGTDGFNSVVTQDSFGSGGSFFYCRRAKGTNASPSALAADDPIGAFGFVGYGTAYATGSTASIRGAAAENWDGTHQGSYLTFYTTSTASTTSAEKMRIDANGNVIIGTAAISTSATNGFLYIPSCAGAPSGTPTSYSGRVPLVYDTSNNKLYAYNGAWKSVTLT